MSSLRSRLALLSLFSLIFWTLSTVFSHLPLVLLTNGNTAAAVFRHTKSRDANTEVSTTGFRLRSADERNMAHHKDDTTSSTVLFTSPREMIANDIEKELPRMMPLDAVWKLWNTDEYTFLESVKMGEQEFFYMPPQHERRNKHLPHLTSEVSLPSTGVTSPLFYATNAAAPTRMIVTNAVQEDMSWLENLGIPVAIYNRNLSDTTSSTTMTTNRSKYRSLVPNLGNEGHTYLRFIIDHYENLPEKVVFLHGHRTSWHTEIEMDKFLSRLRWNDIPFYANFDTSFFQEIGLHSQVEELPFVCTMWQQAGLQEYIGPCPPFIKTECCAQFLVSKERILLRPKRFYQRLLDWLINQTEFSNFFAGMLLEWCWGVIFGQGYDVAFETDRCNIIECSEDLSLSLT